MKQYQVKLVSQKNSIILIFALLAAFIGGSMLFRSAISRMPLIVYVVLPFVIAWFLWQKFVTGRTEWTIDNNGMKMKWTRQFYLNNQNDLDLKWHEIEKISRGYDPNYYTLKIKLLSGRTIRFYHDILTTKDDFNAFITALHQNFNSRKIK